jgi:hypothetical protein
LPNIATVLVLLTRIRKIRAVLGEYFSNHPFLLFSNTTLWLVLMIVKESIRRERRNKKSRRSLPSGVIWQAPCYPPPSLCNACDGTIARVWDRLERRADRGSKRICWRFRENGKLRACLLAESPVLFIHNSFYHPSALFNPRQSDVDKMDMVKLNVGGIRYTTTLTTLKNRSENFLTKLVEHDLSGTMKAQRDECGSFFLAIYWYFKSE